MDLLGALVRRHGALPDRRDDTVGELHLGDPALPPPPERPAGGPGPGGGCACGPGPPTPAWPKIGGREADGPAGAEPEEDGPDGPPVDGGCGEVNANSKIDNRDDSVEHTRE
jgi:hypothetical protein